MPGSFVHLHNHTEYSLLDGAVHIKDLIAECSRMGMPAVAVTDHGNLFGAIELVMETNSLNKSVAAWNKEHPEGPRKQEVKPIFGCEVYLSPTPISVKKQLPGRRKYTHLLLLAENETGWQNLVKLVSRSHFKEKQVGLSDNLMNFDTFLKRGAKWLTAQELAMEGMQKMIKEFGL